MHVCVWVLYVYVCASQSTAPKHLLPYCTLLSSQTAKGCKEAGKEMAATYSGTLMGCIYFLYIFFLIVTIIIVE